MIQNKITKILITLLFIFNVNITFANDSIIYEKLIDTIGYIESRNNPKKVSKDGTCVGYLQIKKICVRECNRILGTNKYTYNDRYNEQKSREMFMVIQKHYNPNGNLIHGIRIWNEGPFYKRNKPITTYVKNVLKIYRREE